ncbi:unnamed protein product [Phytophthora fragariaefolia]|uniref:Unnamed protein product n=1 Tax=Phytophthora fragariaefolia TaxID=1490495 RepID=A0A9W6Y489_9STRA|nr:unnamed protein product [Phytophthora fragariaefolia]
MKRVYRKRSWHNHDGQDSQARSSIIVHHGPQQSDSTDIRVGVARIDTSVQLSQRTLDALLDSESDVELSQAAVPRAFSLSASDLNGLDSIAELPATSPPAAISHQVLRPLVHDRKDVSFISDDESLDDYESSSDGEVVAEEEGNPGRDDSEEDDDEITDTDAVQMNTAFIEALQIGSASQGKKWGERRKRTRCVRWTGRPSPQR